MTISRILPVLACVGALCCSNQTEEERLLSRLDTLGSQWTSIQADAARAGNQADLRRIFTAWTAGSAGSTRRTVNC